MKEERITRRVHQWHPTGKRGRPRKRWMDNVEEDVSVRRCQCKQVRENIWKANNDTV